MTPISDSDHCQATGCAKTIKSGYFCRRHHGILVAGHVDLAKELIRAKDSGDGARVLDTIRRAQTFIAERDDDVKKQQTLF